MPQVKWKRLHPEAQMPQWGTAGAAGADVRAVTATPITLQPGERRLVSTGWAIAVPEGHFLDVRPRSGLALKHGVTVANTPGTVDHDYRGPLGVILINLGQEPFTVNNGDRIAQIVLMAMTPTEHQELPEDEDLDDTARGTGGFGSTGQR